MNVRVEIINKGFFTTVQDGGRTGYAAMGVPESGAMDRHSFFQANALLNNTKDAAMLECTLVGPTIKYYQDTYFVITGAHVKATLEGKPVKIGVPTLARASQTLITSKISQGTRCYIAFGGGIESAITLNSKSWYTPITPNNHIRNGDTFSLGISTYDISKGAHIKYKYAYASAGRVHTIKAYKGPEYTLLDYNQQQLLHQPFTVSKLWNRMAIQLQEPVYNKLEGIMTSPVIPGTVQLTPSGKIIVLMRDCQTTGGYPRILQIAQPSIDTLAQLQQGDSVLLSVT